MRRIIPLFVATAVVVGAAACSKTVQVGDLEVASPGSPVPGLSASATPSTQPSGPPTEVPTTVEELKALPSLTPESPQPHSMTGSSRTVITTDDGESVSLAFTTMDPYSMLLPEGQSSMAFVDDSGNALSVGGLLPEGTFKTSPQSSLNVTVLSKPVGPLTVASGDGSCRITIDQIDTTSVAGSFRCQDVAATKRYNVDLIGTFSGTLAAGE